MKAQDILDLLRTDRGEGGDCFVCGCRTKHTQFKGTFACEAHEAQLCRDRLESEATFNPHGKRGPNDDLLAADALHLRLAKIPKLGRKRPRHYDEEFGHFRTYY